MRTALLTLASLPVALWLGGCTGKDDGPGTDDSATVTPFSVLSIEPASDSTLGGGLSDLAYEGDLSGITEAELDVRFGDVVAEVVAITDTKVVVQVPPSCAPGAVDVSVTLPEGESSAIPFAYATYAAGLDGAIYELSIFEAPAYSELRGSARLGFFAHEAAPPLNDLPAVGTCEYNYTAATDGRSYLDMGSQITLDAGTPIVASLGSDGLYTAEDIPAASMPVDSTYAVSGGVDSEGCAVNPGAVLVTAPALTVTTPLNTSQEFADCWYMDGGGGEVHWDGPHDAADFVVINLTNADESSAPTLTCHGVDDGVFSLAETDLLGLQADLHSITVTRYRITESTLDRSGAAAYGVASDSEWGFIFIELYASGCGQ